MDDISQRATRAYDPKTAGLRAFHTERARFASGADSPRAYLERCLEAVAAREGEIKAFVAIDPERARKAADESTQRYKAGRPLSLLDGLPVAVKDVIETEEYPTEHGSKLFAGHRPQWDAACVYWLKKGGAYVLGKTVTTEFATRPPGPTRNPWDTARTPGGSSSGSAAAVGAGMAPLGLGTQVKGSVLRPAAYCGAFALKPSFGVITNQGLLPLSRGINHLGAIAATLEDAWLTLHYLSRTAGGEPGHAALPGATDVPAPHKPARLVRLETFGWARTGEATKRAFEGLLARLAKDGVEIVGRGDSPEVEKVEQLLAAVNPVSDTIRNWEGRYPLLLYYERGKDKMDPDTVARIEADLFKVTPEDYAAALEHRRDMQRAFAALGAVADGCITLTATGPAPEGLGTGDTSFLDAFSVLGAPTLSLPLLALDGLPLGIQLAGFHRADRRLVALGRWLTAFALVSGA